MSFVDVTTASPSTFAECSFEDDNYEEKPLDVDVEPDGELKGLFEPWYSPDEKEEFYLRSIRALDVDVEPWDELAGFWGKIVTPIPVQNCEKNDDELNTQNMEDTGEKHDVIVRDESSQINTIGNVMNGVYLLVD